MSCSYIMRARNYMFFFWMRKYKILLLVRNTSHYFHHTDPITAFTKVPAHNLSLISSPFCLIALPLFPTKIPISPSPKLPQKQRRFHLPFLPSLPSNHHNTKQIILSLHSSSHNIFSTSFLFFFFLSLSKVLQPKSTTSRLHTSRGLA